MLFSQKFLSHISAPFSIVANFILILLITFKSPPQMGNYKHLLIGVSVFEMSYAVLDIVSETTVLSIKESFVVVVTYKDRFFGRDTAMVLNCIYCAFFGFSMGMFVIIFAYRSFVSTGNTVLRKFKGLKILTWFAFPIFYALVWLLVAWIPLAPFPEMDNVVRDFLFDAVNMTVDEVAYTGPLFYSTIDNSLRFSAILPAALQWVLTASSLFLVIFFGVRCYLYIGKLVDLTDIRSIRLRHLQKQLFVALVFQATVPLILMHIPVTVLYTCCVFNIVFDTFSVATTIALFPAIDPLPTIFIVKSYRSAIFEYLWPFCLRRRGQQETVEHLGSTVTTRL